MAVGVFCVIACSNICLPVWYDEAYSAYLIRGKFSEIWQMTALDVHPPFYYFCLKIWSGLFGSTEFALRSMSVFFVAIGLILAFFLFRRWFGKRIANLACVFMSLSPFLIRYAQEARMYGLVFAIVIGATLVLDIALKSKKKLAWFCYAPLIALGMWTHYFSALAWIAHFVYIIIYMHKYGLQKAVFWIYPLSIICFAPWLPIALHQFSDVQNGFWIPEVSMNTITEIFTLGIMLEKPAKITEWWALLFMLAICAIFALSVKKLAISKKSERKNLGFLCAMIIIPPVALILLSLPPFKPTFVARYVAYSIALMMGFFAFIIGLPSRKKTHFLSVMTIMLIASCVGFGVYRSITRSGENPTKEMIIQAEEEMAAPILFDGDEMDDFDAFFYETAASPVYEVDIDFKWGALEPIRLYKQNYLENIDAFLADEDGFWYIVDKQFDKSANFPNFTVRTRYENNKYLATYYEKH